MSELINEFNVRVEFNPDGMVARVRYRDQEGCGHEAPFSLSTDLDDMVAYHLKHMYASHGITPPKGCGFQLATADRGSLFCTLKPHGGNIKHRFEV